MEGLRGVVAIASELVKEDRLISSSASCAIQSARPSSSAKSSSSVHSIIVGRETGPGRWLIGEGVLGVVVPLADSSNPSPGVLIDVEIGFDGVATSVGGAENAAKLQDESAKYADLRLLADCTDVSG